jgi:hypothetical protein
MGQCRQVQRNGGYFAASCANLGKPTEGSKGLSGVVFEVVPKQTKKVCAVLLNLNAYFIVAR